MKNVVNAGSLCR